MSSGNYDNPATRPLRPGTVPLSPGFPPPSGAPNAWQSLGAGFERAGKGAQAAKRQRDRDASDMGWIEDKEWALQEIHKGADAEAIIKQLQKNRSAREKKTGVVEPDSRIRGFASEIHLVDEINQRENAYKTRTLRIDTQERSAERGMTRLGHGLIGPREAVTTFRDLLEVAQTRKMAGSATDERGEATIQDAIVKHLVSISDSEEDPAKAITLWRRFTETNSMPVMIPGPQGYTYKWDLGTPATPVEIIPPPQMEIDFDIEGDPVEVPRGDREIPREVKEVAELLGKSWTPYHSVETNGMEEKIRAALNTTALAGGEDTPWAVYMENTWRDVRDKAIDSLQAKIEVGKSPEEASKEVRKEIVLPYASQFVPTDATESQILTNLLETRLGEANLLEYMQRRGALDEAGVKHPMVIYHYLNDFGLEDISQAYDKVEDLEDMDFMGYPVMRKGENAYWGIKSFPFTLLHSPNDPEVKQYLEDLADYPELIEELKRDAMKVKVPSWAMDRAVDIETQMRKQVRSLYATVALLLGPDKAMREQAKLLAPMWTEVNGLFELLIAGRLGSDGFNHQLDKIGDRHIQKVVDTVENIRNNQVAQNDDRLGTIIQENRALLLRVKMLTGENFMTAMDTKIGIFIAEMIIARDNEQDEYLRGLRDQVIRELVEGASALGYKIQNPNPEEGQ